MFSHGGSILLSYSGIHTTITSYVQVMNSHASATTIHALIHVLFVHSFPQPGEEYRLAVCNISDNILGHFDPFGRAPTGTPEYNAACTPNTTSGCEVGDLTGKHSTINVQGKHGSVCCLVSSFFFFLQPHLLHTA
jgi:hypothetical protein